VGSTLDQGPGDFARAAAMPLVLPFLAAFALGVAWLQTRAELPDPAWWPVVAGGTCAIVGALLRAGQSPPPGRLPGGTPASAPAAAGLTRRAMAGAFAVVAGGVLVGHGYAAWRAEVRLADVLPPVWEGEDLQIVGVVDDMPRRMHNGVRFAFAVERLDTAGAQVPQRVSLAWQVGWPDAERGVEVPEVRAGERWYLTVRLRRPHGNVNPGAFDLEAWLLERNLRATGYVRIGEHNERVGAFAGRPLDHVQRARERIRDRIAAIVPAASHAAVLGALAIGDQSGLDDRQWSVFNRTGTGHLISVSGLHVTVFAWLAGGVAFALARRCTRLTSHVPARRVAAVFGLGAAFGYVLLAGAEVPAQRTLAMLAVSTLGLWLARPGTGFVVWLWALVAVLAIDPWAVVAPGFWLSFFAVGLLIYAGDDGRVTHRGSTFARGRARIASAARAQWAITLGLVPLSLALFQQVSLIGPLANAVAIPFVTFVVVPIALVAAFVPIDALWQLAHASITPLMHLLEALAALPGAAWAQHAPARWATALGIAGVMLCLAPRGLPGRALGVLAIAPLFVVLPAPPAPGTFCMTVLDVGQGTALVVRTARHALLYDTGPSWNGMADAGGRIVAPWLRAAGIRRLDAMIVSHRDTDHSGGAMSVLAAVPVGLLLTSLATDHPIVEEHEKRGLHLRCHAGQRWSWDGIDFELVFPDPLHYEDPYRKPNDVSCVLRIEAPGGRALVAGDVEATSEVDLVITQRERLGADVLVVPHHGSRTSSTPSFVDAVGARHAVFTVGYRNRFGHPRADVVARYERAGAVPHRTDRTGALSFTFAPGAIDIPAAARASGRRYWHDPAD
jgi:competence protein ComEC